MTRRLLATVAALTVVLTGCGDDDEPTTDESPVMTNEFGVETFAPGLDNPWYVDSETAEPTSQ